MTCSSDDERAVLGRCSVFAGGFDLAAALPGVRRTTVDEYAVLDVLDSLVRKSLVTVERSAATPVTGCWRRSASSPRNSWPPPAPSTRSGTVTPATSPSRPSPSGRMWDGPGQRVAVDWVEAEFANLRAGFRWAADQDDLVTAAAIAAHTAMLGLVLQRYRAGRVGRGDPRRRHRRRGAPAPPPLHRRRLLQLDWAPEAGSATPKPRWRWSDPRYDGFAVWDEVIGAGCYVNAGLIDPCLEICAAWPPRPVGSRPLVCVRVLYLLPPMGRAEEARAIAEETLATARAHGNPYWIACALLGTGGPSPPMTRPAVSDAGARRPRLRPSTPNALLRGARSPRRRRARSRPRGARRGPGAVRHHHRLVHRAGNILDLAATLASLAVFFDRVDQPEVAATVYGASTRYATTGIVVNLPNSLDHLRAGSAKRGSTPVSPPGRRWNPPTPSATPTTRSKSLAVKVGRGLERRHASVGPRMSRVPWMNVRRERLDKGGQRWRDPGRRLVTRPTRHPGAMTGVELRFGDASLKRPGRNVWSAVE